MTEEHLRLFTPPFISISSYDDANIFIRATEREKVLLLLPSHTVHSLGMGVIWGFKESLRKDHPGWEDYLMVDCEEFPGYVLSALRHGIKHIIFRGPEEVWERLQTIVQVSEAHIYWVL